ncbi:hypothetical protein NJL88_31985 [Streptomyces sp. DK15]|uniref:hypothetical protein n=1 Tax=Streptomyces sp. DK15 TaxID=2957499 RepID=UPI0029AA1107|nr:hypothetical protein [Streptomyces sp. DK15]MDX2394611.1 hypothetical protein [Streptomyces sp. DK15]
MTTRTLHPTYPTRPSAPAPGTGRRLLRAIALASTVPYLALKAAWVSGSHGWRGAESARRVGRWP